MKIVEWAKAHPWQTGIIVVVGGIVFLLIFKGGGSSSDNTQYIEAGPSDAEVAASTTLQAAQITANAQISAANIGASLQQNSDNKAAEVELARIAAAERLGTATVTAQVDAVKAAADAKAQAQQSVIGALGTIKKKNRDDVLQALVTGQPYYPQQDTGNSAADILGGVSSVVGSAAKVIPFF